jgi:hypothetical protein
LKGVRKDLTNSIFREREVRGVLQEFVRMETQREMGRDVLRGFVRVASEEERCGSEVK